MRWPRRDTLIPLALGALACAVALLQRPGLEVAETKVDLHVAPGSFLRDVLSAWTPSGSLGHVFAGQYGGYLWPMGPFFALGDVLGLPDWVIGRLWIGVALALSAWGMVRLLDALLGRPRGAAHLVGGLLYMLNPYVVTYVGRTSITLLATAALPWLLLCVHRGLRDPRGWWWPAAFALVLTSTGGGVNVAVTAWLLLGPALLAAYELGWGAVPSGSAQAFAVRLVPVVAVASLWWVAAVLVHARYGLDFLPFTEQPGTIWGTTSLPESLRLLGFWTSYIGVGYTGTLRAFQADAGVYLGLAPVIVATLLVPALCLGSFAWTRRARYAPFFLALVLLGLLVMFVGFPEGAPLRRAATFTYNHVQAVRFLRTSYKAGPLVSLGLAGLGALGVHALRPHLRAAALCAVAVLVAIACWPLARGVGLDRQLGLPHGVPAAWRDAAHDLDRTLPRGRRAMVLPGQLFAFYDWGGTYDPIMPALTDRPVAVRFIVPFADLRAVDLQWTADALVSQQRAVPGQLRPLLDLMGVGAVLQGADDDRARSGAVPASSAAGVLRALGSPTRAYGRERPVPGAAGTLEPAARLPQVRRWDLRTGGMVRVLPRDRGTVVDGSAAALADLAAFGALRTDRALRYAGDLTEPELRAQAARGASFVISDSNRRRAFVAARLRGNTGWTLPAGEDLSEDAAALNPFPRRGTDAQTVARVGGGIAAVHADFSPGFAQFPERRPFAALDGDPATAWLADRALATDRHHLDVDFTAPRDLDHVDLLPYSDGQGRVERVAVNGREFAVGDGWNRLHLGLRGARSLSVRIAHVVQPPTGEGGAGGIRELRIPGVRATEALRPPVLVEHALHGADLGRAGLTYLFDRTTGDDPSHPHVVTGARSRGLVRDQQDGERGWARAIAPPAARAWRADAWVSVAPETPDHVLDAWAGGGATTFDGSSRFEGLGRNRASSAFDGDRGRPWIAGWIRSRGAWLQWRMRAPRTIRTLRLARPPVRVRFPTRVRVIADGRPTQPLAVRADGSIPLPAPLRARTVRLQVLDAAFPPGTPGIDAQRRAVGVGEVTGDGVPRAVARRRGAVRLGCGRPAAGEAAAPGAAREAAAPGAAREAAASGAAREAAAASGAAAARGPSLHVAGQIVPLGVTASVEALDAGRPLRAVQCGAPVELPAAPVTVRADAAPWRLDHVRLTSPARASTPVAGGGRVLDPGRDGRGSRDGVRVAVDGPSWLVLGESYDAGWRARCDGRSLGRPVPLQGYANAWPVDRGCRAVSFAFAPNRALVASDAISLVACLALLALLVLRRPGGAAASLPPLPDAPARAWPLRRALAAGVVAALVLGFVFALRAGAVLGPLTFLVLWRGVPARTLALAAGAVLLVALPILHLAVGLPDEGYDTNYAVQRIAEHWLAVGALWALGAALWLTLDPALARRRGPGS